MITKYDIDNIDFKIFHKIIHPLEKFYRQEENYRLLSYLSTKFNNTIILDIGANLGFSALALSYNDSNLIYSFDIINSMYPRILEKHNIRLFIQDLFIHKILLEWKEIILNSSLIYFDLGPIIDNTNFMMYNFLKSNNYQGIILYNDIKHQYNYDYFWKKIPDTEKVDLTDIGNFMGIGMITFNDDYRRSFF